MIFDEAMARAAAMQESTNQGDEAGLVEAFTQICSFLNDNPDRLSGRLRIESSGYSILTFSELQTLARKYFLAYRRSHFPRKSSMVPDKMVGVVMVEAFGYTQQEIDRIKAEHQQAMSAENCIGVLLERYLDSVLRPYKWYWCCGDLVKAVDFIRRGQDGVWLELQIKNRSNSENSSSSAIRDGTQIQMWYRSFANKDATNWCNLPPLMQGYNLSEQGFENFVRTYLRQEKQKVHGFS